MKLFKKLSNAHIDVKDLREYRGSTFLKPSFCLRVCRSCVNIYIMKDTKNCDYYKPVPNIYFALLVKLDIDSF